VCYFNADIDGLWGPHSKSGVFCYQAAVMKIQGTGNVASMTWDSFQTRSLLFCGNSSDGNWSYFDVELEGCNAIQFNRHNTDFTWNANGKNGGYFIVMCACYPPQ
jgi:hypothetical protein